MRGKTAALEVRPRLELLESKTLLSSFGANLKADTPYVGGYSYVNIRKLFQPWGQMQGKSYRSDSALSLSPQGYPKATMTPLTARKRLGWCAACL